MNRRVVLAQILLYFFMLIFLVASVGCGKGDDNIINELIDHIDQTHVDNDKGETYTASGTYTYSDRTLIMTWTSSDFPCNGPEVGTETNTGVTTITDTTMEWVTGNSIWMRESGTAGDPIGEWKTTSDENTYNLNIKEDGTVSISSTGKVFFCEGDNDTANDGSPWQH
jgi:hypothetical protein